jgi:hypothetical protein
LTGRRGRVIDIHRLVPHRLRGHWGLVVRVFSLITLLVHLVLAVYLVHLLPKEVHLLLRRHDLLTYFAGLLLHQINLPD